jgi:hypothetical protein
MTPGPHLHASTDSEAIFQLDRQHIASNLVLSNSAMTVRNTANKKWSTVCATVKFTNGIHRWDVQIDRCISKNIFIGVVRSEASTSNYVGCDRYGWAFLANKAIWHNKGKIKPYGELFRTGDTITVVLDMDVGTISFVINGKSMGTAAEGLVGPLYPAFSLYNEDDQVSLIPPRPALETLGWSASTAERVIDRLEILVAMCELLSIPLNNNNKKQSTLTLTTTTGAQTQPTEDSTGQWSMTRSPIEELFHRWRLWLQGSFIRSIMVHGDYVSIVVSTPHCHRLSGGTLKPADTVHLLADGKHGLAVVLGYGRHRLWFQLLFSGLICGYTKDSVLQMLEKDELKLAVPANPSSALWDRAHTEALLLGQLGLDPTNHQPRMLIDSPTDLSRLLIAQGAQWTPTLNALLRDLLDQTALHLGIHPLNLHIGQIFAEGGPLLSCQRAINTSALANDAADASITRKIVLLRRYEALTKFSPEELSVRALLLIHVNDMLLPLLPLLTPSEGCGGGDRLPLECMGSLYSLVFKNCQTEHMYRVSHLDLNAKARLGELPAQKNLSAFSGRAAHCTSLLPLYAASEYPSDTGSLAYPGDDAGSSEGLPLSEPFSALTLASEGGLSTLMASSSLLDSDRKTGRANSYMNEMNTVDSSIPTAQAVLAPPIYFALENPKIRAFRSVRAADADHTLSTVLATSKLTLLMTLQTSYIGQFLSLIESLSSDLTAMEGVSWETRLRQQCDMDSVLSGSSLSSGRQAMRPNSLWSPLRIRLLRSDDERTKAKLTLSQSSPDSKKIRTDLGNAEGIFLRAMSIIQLAEDSISTTSADDNTEKHTVSCVSEWTLFSLFLAEVSGEVKHLFDAVFRETIQFPIADTFIVLRIMHFTGVLMGLSIRAGATMPLPLPSQFLDLMVAFNRDGIDGETPSLTEQRLVQLVSRCNSTSGTRELTALSAAQTLRVGLCSIIPEAGFSLTTRESFKALLAPSFHRDCRSNMKIIHLLRTCATFQGNVCPLSGHIELFWLALMEISYQELHHFLHRLFDHASITETKLLVQLWLQGPIDLSTADDSSNFSMRILEPTAVALLSPESAGLTLSPQSPGISIPRYSSFGLMETKLAELIRSFAVRD